MANLEFYYRPPGAGEQSILSDNIWFKGMQGFGNDSLTLAGERVAGSQGQVYVGQEPYAGPRTMTLTVSIIGESYTDWETINDALDLLVTPFRTSGRLGRLRIVKPNGAVRAIDCLMVDDPRSEDIKTGVRSSLRHLTFQAPNPFFYDPTFKTNAFSVNEYGPYSGVLAPVCAPICFEPVFYQVICTVPYLGTAKSWPLITLGGPATNPRISRLYTDASGAAAEEYVQMPFAVAAGEVLTFQMETGISMVAAPLDPTARFRRDMVIGSTRWKLDVGTNLVQITAPELAANAYNTISYYNRFASL